MRYSRPMIMISLRYKRVVSVKPFATADDQRSPLRCMVVIVYSTETMGLPYSIVGTGGLTAVRSRHGSDSHLGCHSLPWTPLRYPDGPHLKRAVIGWLKYQATKEINQLRGSSGDKIFQRSFFDHIVRNRDDYYEIYKYIYENPMHWYYDELYTEQ